MTEECTLKFRMMNLYQSAGYLTEIPKKLARATVNVVLMLQRLFPFPRLKIFSYIVVIYYTRQGLAENTNIYDNGAII